MTAREWLDRTFHISAGDDGVLLFQASDEGDFEHYHLPGVNPRRMPRQPVMASVDMFLLWFGHAIEAALASGGSIYQALTDGTVKDRGWRPYFELWRAKGIID